MKHLLYSLLGCLLLSSNALFAQTAWTFDKSNPLLSEDDTSLLNLHTVRQTPEFVAGLQGKALRTDGYSTWVDTSVDERPSSISGWFALESYPTDTAAFVGVKDRTDASVAVCIDRFGALMLGVGKDGVYSYHPLKAKAERFQWLHILLDLEGKAVYLNGSKLAAEGWAEALSEGKMLIQAGKDFRDKKVWKIGRAHV